MLDLTVQPCTIKIKEYKTSDSQALGEWTKELPEKLVANIEASLQKQPRDYLFVKPRSGLPFTSGDDFGLWHNRHLRRWFDNEAVNNTSLRRARAKFLNMHELSPGERMAHARDMGHTLLTNLKYSHVEGSEAERMAPKVEETASPGPTPRVTIQMLRDGSMRVRTTKGDGSVEVSIWDKRE